MTDKNFERLMALIIVAAIVAAFILLNPEARPQ